jgi:N-acetylglucosamine kinase-like BadF-type ATPase
MTGPAAILAVDGGNSKTELILAGRNGRVLAFMRGGSISHQAVGMEPGLARLRRLVAAAADEAGIGSARPAGGLGVFCLAGADLRSETLRLGQALRREQLADDVVVLNDTRAALRAGSERGWGVAVICGSGVNSSGVAPDGRAVGLPALGNISGDWGGGRGVGEAALAAAVRGRDGRGAHTLLEGIIPAHFGFGRPLSLTWALYHGRIAEERLRELSPLVFAAAMDGDAVARTIVDRLADELAIMALATLRRLRLVRADVDVVLAGGVIKTNDEAFFERIEERIHERAPLARVRRLTQPPVVGAALLGLDRLPHSPAAEIHLRAEVARRAPTVVPG